MLRYIEILPGAWILTFPFRLMRGAYRRFFRKSITNRLVQKNRSNDITAIEKAIAENDYPTFNELCQQLEPEILSQVDWFSKNLDQNTVEVFIQKFQAHHRNLEKAYWLNAMYLVKKAWEARGGGYAETVTRKNYELFSQFLREAKTEAEQSLSLNPNYVQSYQALIRISLGLDSKQNAIEAFEAGKLIEPQDSKIHFELLNALTKKWLGSTEEMFEFARSHYSEDRSSSLNGLIAAAHIEHWIQLDATSKTNR